MQGDAEALDRRRTAIVEHPWTWLDQVHGGRVLVVAAPGEGAGEAADAAVTSAAGAVLAVHTADCGPVALVAEGGAIGVAHAGWRGLAEGVVEEAVARLRALAEGPVHAVVGPHIGAECYAFGAEDLARVAQRLGADVVARTAEGGPALDLGAGIRAALAAAGVDSVAVDGTCTACGDGLWSHRARGDEGRQAVLVWIEGP